MNEEDRALIIVELRLRGVHPTWVEFWLRVFPHDLLELHNNGWKWHDGQQWEIVDEKWRHPYVK